MSPSASRTVRSVPPLVSISVSEANDSIAWSTTTLSLWSRKHVKEVMHEGSAG